MFEDVAKMEKEIENFRKNILASSGLVDSISSLVEETKKQRDCISSSTTEITQELESAIVRFESDHTDMLKALSQINESLVRQLQQSISDEQQHSISEIKKIQRDMKGNLDSSIESAEKNLKELSETGDKLISAFRQDAESVKTTNTAQMQKLAADNATAMETLHQNINSDQEKYLAKFQAIQNEWETGVAKLHEDAEKTQSAAYECIEKLNADCQRIIVDTKQAMGSLHSEYSQIFIQTETAIKGYQAAAEAKYAEFVDRLERTDVDQIFKEVHDLKKSVKQKFALLMCGVGATLIFNILLFVR